MLGLALKGAKKNYVLPPFGKDKTSLANIDFTQFFCQKALFLDF